MNQPHTPTSGTSRSRAISRRAVVRGGLAAAPLTLLGVWVAGAAWSESDGGGTAGVASAQAPTCVVTPQLTEGPYFVDEGLIRSDIRDDPSTGAIREGVPLRLAFRIFDATGGACTPLAGAAVDVWQCDALGVYSDVRDISGLDTTGQRFLRGAQYTDADGASEFLTIYPGWYRGRTVHIHFKIRTDPALGSGYQFTSQLFFDDALTDSVHARPPYNAKGRRDTLNANDGIFQGGSDALTLAIIEEGDGYAATIAIGVDLSAPAAPSGPGGRPGGPPHPGGTP